jgi:hypothetical protein
MRMGSYSNDTIKEPNTVKIAMVETISSTTRIENEMKLIIKD